MRNKLSAFLALTLFATLLYLPSASFAQSTAFTYQGRLNDGANPANGTYDLTFALFSTSSGAGQVGNTTTNSPVGVTNGLFTVTLDFGNQFPGADRWLEVGVRTNGGGAFTNLSPRQPIRSTPYAVRALGAGTADNYVGAVSDSQLSGNIARLNGNNVFSGAVQFNNTNNNFAGSFTGNGAGVTNVFLTGLKAPGIFSWPGNFTLASSPAVGNGPRSIVAADVNGDGKMDLISDNTSGNSLTVLLNNGSGGFALGSTIPVGINSRSVTTADVNADGKPDLICTSQSPGALMVFTNLGNGNFVAASTNGLGGGAGAGNVQMVTAADINGDGRPDLITANGNSPGTASVFTNNGSGGFGYASTNSVGNNPFAITAGDVNGDGSLDLITANNLSSGTLSVLTNTGSGSFVSAVTLTVGNQPRSVTIADVDGDGNRDLICANSGSATVTVLMNFGNGNFGPPLAFGAGSNPTWVTAADINDDGRVDLVCANNISPGTLTVLTNLSGGVFALASTLSSGNLPYAVIAPDVNGDSKPDLVSVNGTGSGTVSVFFNGPTFTGNGAGLFNIPADAITGGLTTNLAVLVPGGFTNILSFTNGILRGIQ